LGGDEGGGADERLTPPVDFPPVSVDDVLL
jgi:hypothetical protein